MRSLLPTLLAIVICGGVGATLAWFVVAAIGWTGVAGAIVTAIVGTILATAMFAGGIAIMNALRPRR